MDGEWTYNYRLPAETFLSMGLDWAVEQATQDLKRNPAFRGKVAEPDHWPFSYQFNIETADGHTRFLTEDEPVVPGRDAYVDVVVHYPIAWEHGLVTDQ